jgi:hypothetical protein
MLEFPDGRIVVRGVDYTTEVVSVLHRRHQSDMARAERELAAAHRAGGERFFLDSSDGDGGEVAHVMHPVHAGALVAKFGTHECLEDKSVIKDYLAQFPSARVKSRSRKPKVGYRGGRTRFGSRITFRKIYP